jgi:hypothetical protein
MCREDTAVSDLASNLPFGMKTPELASESSVANGLVLLIDIKALEAPKKYVRCTAGIAEKTQS